MHVLHQRIAARRPRAVLARAVIAGSVAFLAAWLAAPALAAPPSNDTPPSITGKAQAGERLTAKVGNWKSDSKVDYAYQWRVCNESGSACSNVKGATDKIFSVRNRDVGDTIRVVVTAVNNDGAASAVSKQTDVVTAAPTQAPENRREPTIEGTPRQGETLKAQSAWTGTEPIETSYRWRRCDDKGGDCSFISGANTQTYTVSDLDVGKTMRVLVTASNSAGKTEAISNATAVVRGTTPPTTGNGCTPIAQVSSPSRLLVARIEYTPNRIRSRSEPLIARFRVTAEGKCVSGALVYAVGVPFNRLSEGREVQTDGQGWAEVRFDILPTFELRTGNLVVIFVRARKQGESVLGGVSTRRLVSVRVG